MQVCVAVHAKVQTLPVSGNATLARMCELHMLCVRKLQTKLLHLYAYAHNGWESARFATWSVVTFPINLPDNNTNPIVLTQTPTPNLCLMTP